MKGWGEITTAKGTFSLCEQHFWHNYNRLGFNIAYPPAVLSRFETAKPSASTGGKKQLDFNDILHEATKA